jgi:hypothetical protein
MADELKSALADARRRLLDAGPTRIAAIQELDVPEGWNNEWSRGSRLAWEAAKSIGRGINRLAGSQKIDLKRQEAEGMLDLAGRRYALVHSWMSQLGAAGVCWIGKPGQELSDAIVDDTGTGRPDPLWFTDLLLGVQSAAASGSASVRGAPCRQLTVSVDLHRAAAESAEAVWVPELLDYRELAALPLEVWLDDSGHLRRIRFFTGKESSRSLELWDHGSVGDAVDWTRLPGEPRP